MWRERENGGKILASLIRVVPESYMGRRVNSQTSLIRVRIVQHCFEELFEQVLDTTVIYCDNKSGIRLAENPMFHDKSKHIEIKYPYI